MPASLSNPEFVAIAQFVNYAYDISADSTPGGPLPVLPAGFPSDYSIVAFISATDDFWGYQYPAYYGYVAYSAAKEHVVVAIRGTYFIMEWLIDFTVPMVQFTPQIGNNTGLVNAGNVEEGFYSVFTTLSFTDPSGQVVDLLKFLTDTALSTPGVTIDFVAHSLGGPITSMLAASVGYFAPSLNALTRVTTFAAPAPGDQGFKAFFEEFAPITYRLWNVLDVVPDALAAFDYYQVPAPGIGIYPTTTQLENYDFTSIVCNHSLMTYQWLLDSSWPLASGCGPWVAEASPTGAIHAEQLAAIKRRAEKGATAAGQ